MTYLSDQIIKATPEIYHGKLSFSGNTALNDYLTIEAPEHNDITLTRNSDNIVLSDGYYAIHCVVGVNNSNDIANNLSYRIESGGSLVSNTGSSTKDNKCGVDNACAVVDVSANSTKTIKIKVTEQNGTTSINTNYCSLLIKRVDL